MVKDDLYGTWMKQNNASIMLNHKIHLETLLLKGYSFDSEVIARHIKYKVKKYCGKTELARISFRSPKPSAGMDFCAEVVNNNTSNRHLCVKWLSISEACVPVKWRSMFTFAKGS